MDTKIDRVVDQIVREIRNSRAEQESGALVEKYGVCGRGKTAVLDKAEDYRIKEYDLPSPGEKEVLVRVEGCLVTRRDAAEFLKGVQGYRCPAAGAEGTGKVVKTGGAEVKDIYGRTLKEGDSVITLGTPKFRKTGYGSSISVSKQAAQPCGWYSTYLILREDMKLLRMNGFDLESRMIFRQAGEAAASVDRVCKLYRPEKSARIVVLGCRTEGVLEIAALRAAGFSDIIAVDDSEERLGLAEKVGAAHAVRFTCKTGMCGMIDAARTCLRGELADLAIQCVELPGGNSIARRFLRDGGHFADLTKNSGLCLTNETYRQGERFLSKAKEMKLPLYRLVTHRFHLEEINQANWTVLSGQGFLSAVLNR